jgi:hypothetical protein
VAWLPGSGEVRPASRCAGLGYVAASGRSGIDRLGPSGNKAVARLSTVAHRPGGLGPRSRIAESGCRGIRGGLLGFAGSRLVVRSRGLRGRGLAVARLIGFARSGWIRGPARWRAGLGRRGRGAVSGRDGSRRVGPSGDEAVAGLAALASTTWLTWIGPVCPGLTGAGLTGAGLTGAGRPARRTGRRSACRVLRPGAHPAPPPARARPARPAGVTRRCRP